MFAGVSQGLTLRVLTVQKERSQCLPKSLESASPNCIEASVTAMEATCSDKLKLEEAVCFDNPFCFQA